VYFIGFYYSFKFRPIKIPRRKRIKDVNNQNKVKISNRIRGSYNRNRKTFIAKLVLLIAPIVSIVLLIFLPKIILITPQSSPKIIFWADPYQMPNDNATYELCHDNNIGFMPAVSPGVFNKSNLMNRYKMAVLNGVELHFNFLYPQKTVFVNIGNAHYFPTMYEDYRDWFIDEGIFNSTFVKSFSIDAEPPSPHGSVSLDNFPSKEEIDNATQNLREFISLIKADGKEAGIVHVISYMDELDGDGDIELLLRDVYSLNLYWDWATAMIYRLHSISEETGNFFQDFSGNFINLINNGMNENDKDIMSLGTFYERVAIQHTGGQIHATKYYTFVGNFHEDFADSYYIQNKEYLKDIDICRHFNEEYIFIFPYSRFIDYYGESELSILGQHIRQNTSWQFTYYSIETQIQILMYLAIGLFDRFMFLDV